MHKINLNGKFVGEGEPCYIIAEIGVSFRNFEEGKRLIDSAIDIGVDAIKFQTYEADTISTKNNYYNLEITGHVSQYELHRKLELPKDLQRQVVDYSKSKNVTIFSAPSHMNDLEFMESLDMPIYKIGSDLACHIPLLKKVAAFQKPIILSTGMCTIDEVRTSLNTIMDQGNNQVALMHCVANYPSKLEEANLNAIITLKNEFKIPVGYSDHTIGSFTTLAGAILGANLIERHFRDERNASSPDDQHSLVKNEFNDLIKNIKNFEQARGNGKKIPSKSEQKNLLTNRVSIIAMKKIPKGTKITNDMIDIRRPGTGIQPKYYDEVIGRIAKDNIMNEEPLSWDKIE